MPEPLSKGAGVLFLTGIHFDFVAHGFKLGWLPALAGPGVETAALVQIASRRGRREAWDWAKLQPRPDA